MPVANHTNPSLAAMVARGKTDTLPTEGPFARAAAQAAAGPAAAATTTTAAPAPNAAAAPAPAVPSSSAAPPVDAISVKGLTFCYPDLGACAE